MVHGMNGQVRCEASQLGRNCSKAKVCPPSLLLLQSLFILLRIPVTSPSAHHFLRVLFLSLFYDSDIQLNEVFC